MKSTGLRLSPCGVPIVVANAWQSWFKRRIGKKEAVHLQFRLAEESREYVDQPVATDGVESATQVDAEKLDPYALTLRFRTQPTVSQNYVRRLSPRRNPDRSSGVPIVRQSDVY